MMLLVAIAVLGSQDTNQDDDAIREHVRMLNADEVSSREKAMAALKALPYHKYSLIKELMQSVDSREARGRLGGVLRHLAMRESDALFTSGRLKESLVKQAESEGAAEPTDEADRRIEVARSFVINSFPHARAQVAYPQETLEELKTKYGRWALPALLDFLCDSPPRSVFALRYLKELGSTLTVPPLCGLVRGKDDRNAIAACLALATLHGGQPVAEETLRKTMNDENRSPDVRRAARGALVEMRRITEEKE